MKSASWIGMVKKRFCWSTFSFRRGRWHYITNWCGDTLDAWWVWEKQ